MFACGVLVGGQSSLLQSMYIGDSEPVVKETSLAFMA